MITISGLFEVRVYGPSETKQNRLERDPIKTISRMNKKSNSIFNMVSPPGAPIDQKRKERLLRMSNAVKQGAINLMKRETKKLIPKKKEKPVYIGPERRKRRPNVPHIRRAA